MTYKIPTLAVIVLGLAVGCTNNDKKITDTPIISQQANDAYLLNPNKIKMIYPKTKTVPTQDTFFGTVVKDPYRWLEESVSDEKDKDINQWVASQSRLAEVYLNGIAFKKDITTRLGELWNYEKYSTPFKEGGKLYYYHNSGLQNQAVIYTKEKWNSEPKVFLDPNSFSKDGTVSLGELVFSKNGQYAAYTQSASGSDWRTVFVKDAATGQILEDKVEWLRYSGVSWYKNGFFYSRYDDNTGEDKFTQKNEFHQVYYHQLGTKQAADEIVFADRMQPNRNHNIGTTDDESFLILSVTESTSGNALYYKKAAKEKMDFVPLVDNFKHDYMVVDNVGDKLLVYTNYQAPKYQLIEIDVNNPAPKNWKSLIPQSENTLNSVRIIGGRLVALYTKEITNELTVFELDGKKIGNIPVPNLVGKEAPITLSAAVGKKADAEAYFSMSSFTLPNTICKFNVKTLKTEVWKSAKVPFNSADYQIEYRHYESKDGTKVPVSIVYKKGLKKDGTNPTLLYGYGGFNISVMPRFALQYLPFLENGGVYVVANIRGGGEKGKEWHQAGTQLQKQNVFDDFIAAAEFLIKEKYTSPEKLGIEGRSNGGLLVGACMTQRPELFKVALPIVGVLDMLRYHQFTIGHFWAGDYGRSDDESQFKNLLAYSPVHNAKPTSYPATMIMTADHDDRVVPAHSFKFGAALQSNQQGKNPIIIRIDRKAGHGAGKPTEKQIEEVADKLAFLIFNLGMKVAK